MRSHCSLYFTDIPRNMRKRGLERCSSVTFDFLSDGTMRLTDFENPNEWYARCQARFLDLYAFRRIRDPCLFAELVYKQACKLCESGIPYRGEWKWNATLAPFFPYPCFSLDGRPFAERGSNCVGATIHVLRRAYFEYSCGCQLELTKGYAEAYLPEYAHLALPGLGCIHVKKLKFGRVDEWGQIHTYLTLLEDATMTR